MFILYILLIITALLIVLALASKIKFFLEYKKYPGEKLYMDIQLSVGFVKLTKLIKPKDKSQGKTKKKKSEETSAEEKDKNLIQKIKDYTETFEILKKVYSKNRWHIQKSLRIENVDFHLKFGLFDAAQTGIATGAIWTLLYTALAFADSIGTVKKHFFEVSPVFTEPGFICQGKIKLSVRVISALSVALRLYLTYNKVTKNTNKIIL